ncbi:MAG: PD-(D/E)XK nuclease family protein, partial [Bacteroidetes bacterium]|nr:PD-(D/E)XK nuclease family protein [Bacteroidota bacterium]
TLNEECTNEDKNQFKAKEIGTFYHLIFEKIKDWIIKDGSLYVINDNEFNEIHKKNYDEFKDRFKYYEDFSLLELKKVKDNCKKIIKKDIIQRLADNFKDANFEYEVNYSFLENGNNDNLFLQAIFDVLIKNSDGEWEILDWKTNKIMNDDDLEKIREKYQIQADLYCFILMNMYPKQDKYKMTLLLINADNTVSDNKCYIEYEYNKEQINNIIKDRIKKEINRSTISVNNRFERLDKIIV